MKTISSTATIFLKTIFPIGWTAAWCVMTIIAFLLAPLDQSTINFQWGALTAALITSAVIVWLGLTIKVVRMDLEYLYITNYSSDLKIAFSDVEFVSETFLVGPKLITLVLKSPTKFGRRIRFLPESVLFDAFRSHPIVRELRNHIPK
jgi:hypothetical protein